MKSVMSHSFSQVPGPTLTRSTFNRSRGYKTTFDGDKLIPVGVREVLPGDTVNMKLHFFARLNTPIVPCMDNLFIDTHFFFVPTRIIWDNFRKFMGEQIDPADPTDYTVPVLDHTVAPLSTTGFPSSSIADYYGLPTLVVGLENINALPFRAYRAIFNEWYRDQNLQDSYDNDTGDGPDDPDLCRIYNSNKKHDYFTSCLPWAQKNNTGTEVLLPLGSEAPIFGDNMDFDGVQDNANYAQVRDAQGASANLRTLAYNGSSPGTAYVFGESSANGTGELKADLSNATASTINDLRQAWQVQRLFEKDARGGTRYPEMLKSHFGVSFYDLAYRPEFLGGGSQPINITQVPQTESSDATTPQGTLAAYGTTGGSNGFVKSFVEHGYIIAIVRLRADITYQEGIDRLWSRQTRLDYYWPTLSHLGEQAVLNKEIYADASAADEQVFGYQERYAEYRYGRSQITGTFRSNHPTSLDIWHASQEFGSLPTLNSAFIQQATPWDRMVATPAEDHLKFDAYFDEKWTRCMPVYSVPGLVDHL